MITKRNKVDIYRIGNTDTFACNDCRLKGDKWFMREHDCNNNSISSTSSSKNRNKTKETTEVNYRGQSGYGLFGWN